MAWPDDRPGTYNEDKVWNEESETWVAPETLGKAGGDRFLNRIVVLSGQGEVYFGDA